MLKSLKAALFRPTTALAGDAGPTLFRGVNWVLRGIKTGNPYFEIFKGNKDLGENHTLSKLTGTVTFTANSEAVNGSGTVFLTELHPGQLILAGTEVLAVRRVDSNLAFTCWRAPATSAAGVKARFLLQMGEIDGKRYVMRTGSVVKTTKGHYIAVGSGTLKIDGDVLPNESLVASSRPKIAIFRRTTRDYIVEDLGFEDVPPQPTVEMIEGGTKGMRDLSKHSIMVSYWAGAPEGSDGFSNPCDPVRLDIDGNPIRIDGDNNKLRVNLTPSLVDAPDNVKGFIIWKSLEGKDIKTITGSTVTIESPNESLYQNGPWFQVAKVLTSDLLTGNLYEFDALDQDLGREVSGGNDRPVSSEYVVKIDGRASYVSCLGEGTTDTGDGGNPGPSVVISKADNPDAAPLEWVATAASTIIGVLKSRASHLLLMASGIDIATPTGLYGQQTSQGRAPDLPLRIEPFWESGAANRYSMVVVDDNQLIGRSGGKFIKSISEGDKSTQRYEFGAIVEEITDTWNDGHVLTGDDSHNGQALFIHSAAYKNAQGYWVTEILPYLLLDVWLPKIVLSSPTRDMIVSGVAKIDNNLDFICGGRVAGGAFEQRTYRFGAGETNLTSMQAYLLWQPSDDGYELTSKQINSFQVTGKLTTPVLQIHGARSGGSLSIRNMENGTGDYDTTAYFSGDITLGSSRKVKERLRKRVKIKNLSTYAVRLESNWNGRGIPDRLEEIVIGLDMHGRER